MYGIKLDGNPLRDIGNIRVEKIMSPITLADTNSFYVYWAPVYKLWNDDTSNMDKKQSLPSVVEALLQLPVEHI